MKRKKKGGYNLRKSLAWDRAFFEEEGVLNSEELSMITGNVNSSGSLSVIHEETSCDSDTAYLQDLEENLFKVNPGSTPKKDRITGGSPLSKHASPARDNTVPGSAGRRKVLSARDSNRSGSKRSGCPRPLASSSLKRPANVNTIMSATKEPKVSKLPVPKPVPCALSKTSKNVTVSASDLKRSQIAHPVNLNNTKTGLNNEKVGSTGKSLTAKSFTSPTRRNVASYVKCSPTKAQCPPVTEANNGLQVIKKQARPSTSQTSYGRDDRSRKIAVPVEETSKQALPSASHASYCRDDRLRKVVVPLPHTGPNLPHTQLQTSKPSGLRMPSPSLSFFHQPKASSLPGPGKSSSQPCKIPNVRQIGSVNPIHQLKPPSLSEMPNPTNAGTVIGNTNVQCSSSVPSAITHATMEKVDLVSQIRLVQPELKLPSNSKGYGITEDHRKLNSIPGYGYQKSTPQAEPNITEELSYMEDVKFQGHDKYLMDQGSSLVFPPKSTEIQGDSLEKDADASAEVQNGSAAEYKIFDALSYSRCEDQANDDSSTLKTMSTDLHVDDAQTLASDRKVDEINDVKQCASSPDNWQLVKIDSGSEKPEHLDLSNPCYIGEQVYQDDWSDLNERVLDDFDVLPEKTQHNNVLLRAELKEPEGNGAGTVESAVSRNLHVTTPVMLDCRSNEAEMVYSPNVENIASISGDDRPVVENHNLDTQFRNDIRLHGQACMELHNMDEDERRDSLTAHDIKATLKSGGSTSQLNLTMQIEAGSAKDTIEHRYFGFKGSDLSVESSCHAPHLQPEDDIISCHQDTSMVQTKFIVDKINVSEEETNASSGEFDDDKLSAEQAKQVVSCSSAEVTLLNWDTGDYGHLFEGSKSVEECHKYDTGNIKDSLKVNLCDASGLQGTPDLSMHEKLEEANQEIDVIKIKEPLPGFPEDQSSVANCRHSVDFNNAHELSASLELEHPNIVAVQVSQELKPISDSNGTWHSNNTSCNEYAETDDLVIDQYDACGSEPKCSNACTEVAPAIRDGRPDLGGEVDYSQLELAVTKSSMVEQSSENVYGYKNSRDTNRLCDQAASVDSDSSSKTTNQEDSVQTLACNSLEGKSRPSLISDQTSSSESILQNNEVTLLSSNSLAEDAETNILKSNRTLDDEVQQELDATKELKKSSGRKQHGLVIKPPPDAVPFSDEWLAAIEAAGEEILTKKGGAVQHSPPNKSPPQLGPYSPVKRKQNQVIGPFDCTKHTNNPPGSQ
uniref:uncharacterized protein LOC101293083 n=1 Tax=Fragaria vesca subsp. vesca TaxID=101020 RepID=UPI0005C886AA|nr:PREDICTED: uncharacterized protein LOC101293083 [Fragaria vesca subsp. vesca]